MQDDTNAAIWKSDAMVQQWVAGMDERERARAEQFRFLALLLPFDQQDQFTFLDLGAGTGVAARAILAAYPRAQAVLADYSAQMIGEGARVMAPWATRYRYVEMDMLAPSAWPEGVPSQLDAVLTSQCIHHLPDERKRTLFREIYDRLAPGGWYLNFDPIKAATPSVEQVWDRVNDRLDPTAAQKRTHRAPQEQARYENHVRYMTPLAPQLAFLREARFDAVDVYWKQLDYVIYGGYRPAR